MARNQTLEHGLAARRTSSSAPALMPRPTWAQLRRSENEPQLARVAASPRASYPRRHCSSS